MFDQEVAHVFWHLVGEAGTVTVEKVQKSEQRRTKPTAINTVEMLNEASKVLGLGPAQTMSIAERLYLSGYFSYPRYVVIYASYTWSCPRCGLRSRASAHSSPRDWYVVGRRGGGGGRERFCLHLFLFFYKSLGKVFVVMWF